MSGDRYLLDTNAIIGLLRGATPLLNRLKAAEWVGISILSQIEFLAFPNITASDRDYFAQFLDRIEVVGIDRTQKALIDRIVGIRQQYRLKLPDAIVVATALESSAILVTEDQRLQNIPVLTSIGLN